MSGMSPKEFAKKIGAGLLSFPVTHFTADASAFDERAYREHIDWLLEFKPAGLFAAGGTGEFFSLTLDEFSAVVSAAVSQTNGRVPVVAGLRVRHRDGEAVCACRRGCRSGWDSAATSLFVERGPGRTGGARGGGVRCDEAGSDFL